MVVVLILCFSDSLEASILSVNRASIIFFFNLLPFLPNLSVSFLHFWIKVLENLGYGYCTDMGYGYYEASDQLLLVDPILSWPMGCSP